MIIAGLVKPKTIFSFTVQKSDAENRIDSYITNQFPYYSRNFFQRLIDDQRIKINDQIVTKQSVTVKENDVIAITFPPERSIEPDTLSNENLGVRIVNTHKHFMIIYKPANLLIHSPTPMHTDVTLVDWILHNHKNLAHVGYVDRPGIVHRLDRDTSGILIIPRTNYAHSVFGQLFKKRTISKTYHAVVKGHPSRKGTIDLPIGRDPITRAKMTTFKTTASDKPSRVGNVKIRHAITHYKVLEYFENATFVEVKPITGRTHQIRVHFAAIGHPLIGDQIYGEESKLINRQALHAYGLSFVFDGTKHTFSHDTPKDFQELLAALHSEKKLL